jgi:serine phosphatase RsbU (regulator of sigma subunit)
MDAILFCFEDNSKTITYSAANNAPFLIRGGVIIELPKDKMPVGKGEKTESFTLNKIEFIEGDSLYLYTDGFADQFGGLKGKKFKYKQLNDLILTVSDKPFEDQKNILDLNFQNWKGNLEQVDDVCIIGIKI